MVFHYSHEREYLLTAGLNSKCFELRAGWFDAKIEQKCSGFDNYVGFVDRKVLEIKCSGDGRKQHVA